MAKQKQQEQPRNLQIVDRTIEDFFMTQYFDYAKYTISNRALPSIIDGLKPGARKIMHAAFSILSTKKESNFIDLVGTTLAHSKYHHGDSSLQSTIMTLATAYNDSLAPLEIVGSGGELRNQEAAAPRYLGIKLSPMAKLLQKDQHILEYNYDGDTRVEPKYYLPLIPLVLTARTTGMSIGYKYKSEVSYNPYHIVKQCISVLETGQLSEKLIPHVEQFKGKFALHETRVWQEGRFEIHPGHILVTEFGLNETSDSFEANLKKLLSDGKITNWENLSTKNETLYKIHVNQSQLANEVQKERHFRIYGLGSFLTRPTYTLLNEHGKIEIFQSAEDVLKYFVDFRLDLYEKLKSVGLANLDERLYKISYILKFLDLYFSGEIELSKDVAFADTLASLDKHNLPHEVTDIPMKRLTKEEYDKLVNERQELTEERELLDKTPVKELYLKELNELAKELKTRFPIQEYEILAQP